MVPLDTNSAASMPDTCAHIQPHILGTTQSRQPRAPTRPASHIPSQICGAYLGSKLLQSVDGRIVAIHVVTNY